MSDALPPDVVIRQVVASDGRSRHHEVSVPPRSLRFYIVRSVDRPRVDLQPNGQYLINGQPLNAFPVVEEQPVGADDALLASYQGLVAAHEAEGDRWRKLGAGYVLAFVAAVAYHVLLRPSVQRIQTRG